MLFTFILKMAVFLWNLNIHIQDFTVSQPRRTLLQPRRTLLSYSVPFLLPWRRRQVIILFAVEGTVLYLNFWHCLKLKLKQFWEIWVSHMRFAQDGVWLSVVGWVFPESSDNHSLIVRAKQSKQNCTALKTKMKVRSSCSVKCQAQLCQWRVTSQNTWIF
jgi:hypothetical protein